MSEKGKDAIPYAPGPGCCRLVIYVVVVVREGRLICSRSFHFIIFLEFLNNRLYRSGRNSSYYLSHWQAAGAAESDCHYLARMNIHISAFEGCFSY